jgi:hypothetical protein
MLLGKWRLFNGDHAQEDGFLQNQAPTASRQWPEMGQRLAQKGRFFGVPESFAAKMLRLCNRPGLAFDRFPSLHSTGFQVWLPVLARGVWAPRIQYYQIYEQEQDGNYEQPESNQGFQTLQAGQDDSQASG